MKRGFTLIELMVVIAVVAILSTLAFLGVRSAQASARDASREKMVNTVRAKLEQYYVDNKSYLNGSGRGDTFGYMVLNLGVAAIVSDPGCGTGPVAFPIMGGDWAVDAPATCSWQWTRPVYSYSGTANSTYTLTLTKEGGGTKTWTQP